MQHLYSSGKGMAKYLHQVQPKKLRTKQRQRQVGQESDVAGPKIYSRVATSDMDRTNNHR